MLGRSAEIRWLLFAIFFGCSAALPGGSTLGPHQLTTRATGGKPLGPAVPGITRDVQCSVDQVEATLVRRLSHVEYERSVAILLPGLELPKQSFAADLRVHGFENNSASLNPSTVLVEQYHDAAVSFAHIAAASPSKILPCTPRGPDIACASQFIESFGLHAFRRPLTSQERYRYETFFTRYMRESGFEVALELILQAFLQSPQFLYRLELSANTQKQADSVALDDYEMASRLSFFLWQSMPDDVLFAAAANAELHTPDQVRAQAQRMLADPRGVEAIVDFHRQWLDFDRLSIQNKDPQLFPEWNDNLGASMREELERFVTGVFTDGSGTLNELLTSNASFVNKPLANLYGVRVKGSDWQHVSLPEDQRAGILTRAGFLASEAHSTNGSPPLRGVAILDELLCDRPPPPPASANTSNPNGGPTPRSNRQLFEERTASASCQGCHESINGIGYGLEAFDAIGKYRSKDNGVTVDASGKLSGTDVDGEYEGAVALSAKLAASKQVRYCAVRHWYRYAFGRNERSQDWCKLDALYDTLEKQGGDFRRLLVELTASYEFMHRPANKVHAARGRAR